MFLCREVVRKHITRNNLDKLELPKRLVELYVSESPLIDEQLFHDMKREIIKHLIAMQTLLLKQVYNTYVVFINFIHGSYHL